MFQYGKIKDFFNLNKLQYESLRGSFALICGFFSVDKNEELRLAVQSLIAPIVRKNGYISGETMVILRKLAEENFSRSDAEKLLAELEKINPMPENDAVRLLTETDPSRAKLLAEFILALAVETGFDSGENNCYVKNVCTSLGMSDADYSTFAQKLIDSTARKRKLANSWRGVLAVLIIIAVFILTAKWLQSVVFGLILACIFLPLEKFFEKKIEQRKGFIFIITSFCSFLTAPLKKFSRMITRKNYAEVSGDPQSGAERKQLIRQAVTLTVLVVFVISAIAGVGVSKLTGKYMNNVQKSIMKWENTRLQDQGDSSSIIVKSNYYVEQLRHRFENFPPVRSGLDFLSKVLNDPQVRDDFFETLLRHSGGIFYFTTGMMGMVISLLGNALLTIFFALLFLQKLAEACKGDNRDEKTSEYIVKTFFNGIWLPGADSQVISEACRIISGIFFRLKVWLKGYLTLILIDSTVYTTSFFILGVPFFLPLGILAGCGIALPYLGPVLSCCTTLLVTIAAGGASSHMLLAIVICYCIYNGIIEQFILYPAVIGEALGLSTLETIIIVLLGAVFAGIPGMIFALPAASVAKYIVPLVYRGLLSSEHSSKI